jgi:hypothetical protein
MDANQLTTQLSQFEKRRAAQHQTILVQMLQQIAKANQLTDEEMRALDATMRAAGVTRPQLAEMLRTIQAYHKRPIVTAADEAKLANDLETAKLDMKTVMAQRSMLPALARTPAEQDAREHWFHRRDEATQAVHAAEAAIKRLNTIKAGTAAIETRFPQLVAGVN